jgi:hypothetical protein
MFLLLVPAFGSFLSEYVSGWFETGNNVSRFIGILGLGVFSLILPLPVAILTAIKVTKGWRSRLASFFLSLLLMFFIWRFSAPHYVKAYLIGRTHSLARQFPIENIRQTGERLLKRYETGTLRTLPSPGYGLILVDEVELPVDLRGKFIHVSIDDPVTVFFAVNSRCGFLVGLLGRYPSTEFYLIEPGIYAYAS